MKKILVLLLLLPLIIIQCTNNKGLDKKSGLPNSPDMINPLKIGDKIPHLKFKDYKGNDFDLSETIKKKPTILIYYRGGWCMYCNNHLGQIQEIEQQLFDLGYQIIAISADLASKESITLKKHNLHYILLSDSKMVGAKSLGLAYYAGDIYNDMLGTLEEYSGEKHYILPVPAAYVIDTQGIIKFEYINPNFKVRINPKLLLVAAEVSLKK